MMMLLSIIAIIISNLFFWKYIVESVPGHDPAIMAVMWLLPGFMMFSVSLIMLFLTASS